MKFRSTEPWFCVGCGESVPAGVVHACPPREDGYARCPRCASLVPPGGPCLVCGEEEEAAC